MYHVCEDAYELFVTHNYKYNRRFDLRHATELSRIIKVAISIDIAIGPNGFPVVVNGQHTLWAIYTMGTGIAAAVTVYQCRDEASIARLFAIFDSPIKRSPSNVIEAAKGSGSLVTEVPSNRLHRWSQCAAVAHTDFYRKSNRESNTDKVTRATRSDVLAFAEWMESIVKDNLGSKLLTQGIGAACYAMFVSDKQKATDFVSQYISGAGLEEDSPIFRLREKMLSLPKGLHGASVCRTHAEFAFSAWRKFCLGEPVILCRRISELPSYDSWKIYSSPEPRTN